MPDDRQVVMALHTVPPQYRMSWRARAWLLVLAGRHLSIGCFALFAPDSFSGDNFDVITDLLPLQAWGVLFIVIALHAVASVVVEHEWWARLVVCVSAAATACWAAGFLGAAAQGKLHAPTPPIIWASLTLKDLAVAAMPFRLPFERFVDEPGT